MKFDITKHVSRNRSCKSAFILLVVESHCRKKEEEMETRQWRAVREK
jgi:hypothetical protein